MTACYSSKCKRELTKARPFLEEKQKNGKCSTLKEYTRLPDVKNKKTKRGMFVLSGIVMLA